MEIGSLIAANIANTGREDRRQLELPPEKTADA
jgi:hypothetical protein